MLVKKDRPGRIVLIPADKGISWWRRFWRTLGLGRYYICCDGLHDQEAFMEGREFLPKNPGGEEYVSAGIYNFSAPFTISDATRPGIIRGAGIGATLVMNNGAGDAFVLNTGGPLALKIADMTIRGSATTARGVEIGPDTNALIFENLHLLYHGEEGVYAQTAYSNTYRNVKAMYCGQAGVHSGFEFFDRCHWTVLEACAAQHNSQYGIYFHTTCNGVAISHPVVESNAVGGLLVAGAAGLKLSGGYFEFNVGRQIFLQSVYGGGLEDVYVHGDGVNSTHGVWLEDAIGNLVKGMAFSGHITASINTQANTYNNQIGPNFSTDAVYAVKGGKNIWIDYRNLGEADLKVDGAIIGSQDVPTYGAVVPIDLSLGNIFTIVVTDGNAFTIDNPTNALTGCNFTIVVYNNSGGALGVITWGNQYKMTGWANPANGMVRAVEFVSTEVGKHIQAGAISGDITY